MSVMSALWSKAVMGASRWLDPSRLFGTTITPASKTARLAARIPRAMRGLCFFMLQPPFVRYVDVAAREPSLRRGATPQGVRLDPPTNSSTRQLWNRIAGALNFFWGSNHSGILLEESDYRFARCSALLI